MAMQVFSRTYLIGNSSRYKCVKTYVRSKGITGLFSQHSRQGLPIQMEVKQKTGNINTLVRSQQMTLLQNENCKTHF